MKKTTTLELSEFALNALAGEVEAEPDPPGIDRALRYYLYARDADRSEWAYPSFLGGDPGAAKVVVELELDDALLSSLELEAERQGTSTQDLAEHAVLYFAADRDAGRITQRILDAFEE